MAVRKPNPRTIPEEKKQVNFNIENDLLERVDDVVWEMKKNDRSASNTQIYNAAIREYLDKHYPVKRKK